MSFEITTHPARWGGPTFSIREDGKLWRATDGRRRAWSTRRAAEEAIILYTAGTPSLGGVDWKGRALAMYALAQRRRNDRDDLNGVRGLTAGCLPYRARSDHRVSGEETTVTLGRDRGSKAGRVPNPERPKAKPKRKRVPRVKLSAPAKSIAERARAYLDAHPKATYGQVGKAVGVGPERAMQLIHGGGPRGT